MEEEAENNVEVDNSPDDIEVNVSNNVENPETTDEMNSNLEEKNENDIKDDEDEKSNHEDMDVDGDEGSVANGSLKEDQVPIEENDDNDVMSPNEVSREASAQSARSGVLSPLNVSPKALSRLATPSPTSPKSQTSRSASRLSSKRSPSTTLNPNTYNTYTSPSKSPGLVSPRMGSSSSRKSSKQVSRASSRLDASKLGKQYLYFSRYIIYIIGLNLLLIIISNYIIGESQKSKLSTRALSSNSLRATSAGAGSVTDQPPTSSTEDLKQDIEDDKSQKSIPPSENDGDKTPINIENEGPVTKDDDMEDEVEGEVDDSTSSNRQDEENIGNCIEIML